MPLERRNVVNRVAIREGMREHPLHEFRFPSVWGNRSPLVPANYGLVIGV